MLVEAPQTPDEVIDHLLGPEIREKFPIHLGFYLKPVHKEMIEEINQKLHRGRSAIVRRAIEHLYLDLKRRQLLRDSVATESRSIANETEASGEQPESPRVSSHHHGEPPLSGTLAQRPGEQE
jgi:hypothetical protein